MERQTRTPCIEVAIGRETRLYHAFVTTAPAKLDAPATLTLYAAPLSDVSGMAADPMVLDTARGTGARATRPRDQQRARLAAQRATARRSTSSHQPIPSWSAWTPCSTGCGAASAHRSSSPNPPTRRPPQPQEERHEHRGQDSAERTG